MDVAVERQLTALVRAAGQEPRGLLCQFILVPEEAIADATGADLVQAVVEFVNWATYEALLLPTEFPTEAFCAYFADYYLAQVNNGGHAQWAGNSGYNPIVVKAAGWGLEAMGAQDYLAIYREFVRLMENKAAAAKIMEGGGFGERAPEEDALNDRLYALDPKFNYPMLKFSGDWLRALPILKPLSPDALSAARAAVVAANPYHTERKEKARRQQEAQILHWAPMKLCASAGVLFDRLTAGDTVMINGKRRFAWYMTTDRGLMLMAMFKSGFLRGPTARLYRAEPGRAIGSPLATASITLEDYGTAVPRQFYAG